jgi:hypothetical protein
MTTARLSLVLVFAAALGCGNGTSAVSNVCPPIASAGNSSVGPVGTWVVTDSCQVPYAQTATADWCSQLVYGDSTVKDGLFLGQAFLPILTTAGTDATTGKFNAASWVTYTDDGCPDQTCGQYSAKITFSGQTTTKFPKGCLELHTPNPTCDDLQKDMQTLITNDVLPMIQMLNCADDGAGSCDCTYVVTNMTVAGDVGSWRLSNGVLMHYPSLPAIYPPEASDFSLAGDSLQVHGHAGVPLLAHDPLRTLTLTRAPAGFNPSP